MEFWFPVNIYEVKFLCHWFCFKATHDAQISTESVKGFARL